MKIEIQNVDPSGVHGYKIYDLYNRRFVNNNKRNFDKLFFDEGNVYDLLGTSQYKKFESGKYEFNVLKGDIYAISDDFRYYTLQR